jgi:hypothetical protein
MINDVENIPSIINPDPCIFCLNNDQEITIYSGNCNCHPPVHTSCIDTWYKKKPKCCPICLKNSALPLNYIIIGESNRVIKAFAAFCFTCLFGVCFSPFILVGMIVVLYNPSRRYNAYNNSTM